MTFLAPSSRAKSGKGLWVEAKGDTEIATDLLRELVLYTVGLMQVTYNYVSSYHRFQGTKLTLSADRLGYGSPSFHRSRRRRRRFTIRRPVRWHGPDRSRCIGLINTSGADVAVVDRYVPSASRCSTPICSRKHGTAFSQYDEIRRGRLVRASQGDG